MKIVALCVALLLFSTGDCYAITVTLEAGRPSRTGVSDVFQVTLDGTVIDVEVPIVDRDPISKAARIAATMKAKGIPFATHSPPTSNRVVIDSARVTSVTAKETNSGEEIRGIAPAGIGLGVVGFHGTVGGVDDDGFSSVFHSSFGFSGLLVDASLTLGSLSSPTLSGLLTDTFNEFLSDLPLSLRSLLSLDLANDRIVFAFPRGESDYFVQNFTSDTTLGVTIELAAVPEPSTFTLFAVAIVSATGYACARRTRRRSGGGAITRGLG